MPDIKTKTFLQPAFVICVSILVFACVGKEAMLKKFIVKKIPVDLRKSFNEMDREKLAPYKVSQVVKIKNKEVIKSLGTEDYIQWILEDPEVSDRSPVKYCSLFITYYGIPDRVPHVPDECYIGSGFQQKDAKHVSLDIEGKDDPVKMRQLLFGSMNPNAWPPEPEFSRMYFFKVDYDYQCTRTGVRASLGKNVRGKHSFFSKVEWEFFGSGFGGRIRPSDKQNKTASEKLISKILPILESEHWPDLDELKEVEDIVTNVEDGLN